MSRWGVAAFVAALAAVIAIGMVAIRVSDRSSTTSAGQQSATPSADASPPADPSPSTDPATGRSDRSDRSAARVVPNRRMQRKPVGRQARWLKRKLDARSGDVEDFFVTVSLRKPIPLKLADGRRGPLPDDLSGATVYTLYTESRNGKRTWVQTRDPADSGTFEPSVPSAARRRLVVVGMATPLGEYRDVTASLRSLPVESRIVSTTAKRAEYVPGGRFGKRALRSWTRFYRRS